MSPYDLTLLCRSIHDPGQASWDQANSWPVSSCPWPGPGDPEQSADCVLMSMTRARWAPAISWPVSWCPWPRPGETKQSADLCPCAHDPGQVFPHHYIPLLSPVTTNNFVHLNNISAAVIVLYSISERSEKYCNREVLNVIVGLVWMKRWIETNLKKCRLLIVLYSLFCNRTTRE